MKYRTYILIVSITISFVGNAKQTPIDSLEQYAKIAKPGWDQIDVAIGLARLYVNLPDLENTKKQVEIIRDLSDKYGFPEGQAYAHVQENLIAYLHENDDDKAIEHCLRAIEIAIETGCNDALIYASYQLAENYAFEKGDHEKAKEILLNVLTKIDDDDNYVSLKNIGHLYKNLGYVHGQLGNYEVGLKYIEQSLNIFNGLVSKPDIHPKLNRVSAQYSNMALHVCIALDALGNIYIKKGDIEEALDAKFKALEVAKKQKFKSEIAYSNSRIGSVYFTLGDYKTALSYLQIARLQFEEMNWEHDIVECNNLLVTLLRKLKDFDVAEKYVNENIAYYHRTNDSLFLSHSLLQAVELQLDQKNWQEAQVLVNKSEPIIFALDNTSNQAKLIQSKGHIASGKGALNSAKKHFTESRNLFKRVKNELEMSYGELYIANVFFKNKEYDSAQYYTNQALNHSKEHKTKDLERRCYLFLSKLYEAQNDYKKAYDNYKAFFAFHDSIYSSDAQSKLKEEQVRQDVISYKNEKELAEKNAELLEEQNQIYLILGFVLMCFTILVVYFFFNQKKAKNKIETQNFQLSQLNQTKDKFFGIIAHDIRSPLLGLQSVGEQIDYFTKKQQPERLKELSAQVESTTKKLTELLDNLLNWALLQNGMIPYHPERVNLKETIESVFELLQPLASLKEIEFLNNVKEDIFVNADNKSVNTILRNIVSNALKFTHIGGNVTVEVESKKDLATIIINDTGTGISAEQVPKLFELEKESIRGTMGEKGSGLGLVLCKELIELNKGSIKVLSEVGKGSSFIFSLPLIPSTI